ncbi:tripartite motif-containing protein 77-like isoform X1 [Bubalus kerabau]|uniref:tripartite motif-containing protein 77-like isoform X1 n=1 Tax=Bubalus carabanensis TaxID=3119969 RepID=UPI00244EB55F|nr:tripartite motif-containing protein 77-like isoform X1 [Bubalus carabanensis]XP_055437599.1 tripartite motif-containing protein 77-like isoform X1 [Bubalus carabanensis]
MASASTQCLPAEIICSICKDTFTDPATIRCGHRFCTPCLCLLWEDAPTVTCCPVCKAASPKMDLKSTILAKKHIRSTGNSVICQLPGSAKQMCRTHQVIKLYFCEADKSLLCLFCSRSTGHATHKHYSVMQVAEHYREHLLMQMKSIWKKKQENQRNIKKVTNTFRAWEGFINLRLVMIRAEYPKVCQYLQEEKQKHLEMLAIEGTVIFQRLTRNVARMIHMGKLLRKIYEELKEMCLKADVDMLQGVEDTMKRSQLMQLYIPQPLDPQLSTWTITGMLERLNSFRVYITLDGKIRNGCVPLIEALRRLQCGPVHRDVPWDPARPENTPTWGAQTFTAGKHYWEVDVGNSCDWAIGLCKESWTSRNDMLLNSEDIFLLLCVSKDGHFSLFSTFPFLPHYIQRPQGYIGVFLDYECGMISFINVARGSLICNFLSRSFSFPLRPFIWCGPK